VQKHLAKMKVKFVFLIVGASCNFSSFYRQNRLEGANTKELFPTEDKIQVVPRSVRVMVDRYIRQQLQMMVDNLMTGGGGGAVRGAVRNHMYHLTVPFRPMKL